MRRSLCSTSANRLSVRKAEVRKDFYTLRVDGVAPDHFEAELGKVETAAATAFTAILRDRQWPLAQANRLALAVWIAVQYLRGHDKRAMAAAVHGSWRETEIAPASTSEIRELLNMPQEVTDGQVEAARERILAADDDTAEIEQHMHLASIRPILERAIPAVLLRPWTHIEFTWDALGTSDTPVVRIPGPDATGPVGLGDAAELYVPLTSRAGLYLGETRTTAPDRRTVGTASLAATMNLLVLHGAHRTLYYRPETDPFAGLPGAGGGGLIRPCPAKVSHRPGTTECPPTAE